MLAIVIDQKHVYWKIFRESSRYISSTQIAPMLSCSLNKSQICLWQELNARKKRSTFTSYAMQVGIDEEAATMEICIEELGLPPERVKKPGIILDVNKGPFSCSPDGMFVDDWGNYVGIEIKNPQKKVPLTPSEISPDHLLQCFSSVHITDANHWILFYKGFLTGQKSCFFIRKDEKTWERIKQLGIDFINRKDCPKRRGREQNIISGSIIHEITKHVTLVQMPQ